MAVLFHGKPVSPQTSRAKSKKPPSSKQTCAETTPPQLPRGPIAARSATAPQPTTAEPSAVAASFQRLIGTATKLNEASDQLTATVDRLDAALKNLNLGVIAWVDVKYESNEEQFVRERIGYMRVGAKWGIALQSIAGLLGDDADNFDDHLWLFTDAPRELRLRAVEKIPELIEALDRASKDLAERVTSKIHEVNQLAAAIEGQTGESE